MSQGLIRLNLQHGAVGYQTLHGQFLFGFRLILISALLIKTEMLK